MGGTDIKLVESMRVDLRRMLAVADRMIADSKALIAQAERLADAYWERRKSDPQSGQTRRPPLPEA